MLQLLLLLCLQLLGNFTCSVENDDADTDNTQFQCPIFSFLALGQPTFSSKKSEICVITVQLNLFLKLSGFLTSYQTTAVHFLTSFLSFWLVSVITLKRTLKGLRLNQKESMLTFKQALKCHHDLKAVTHTVLQQEGTVLNSQVR